MIDNLKRLREPAGWVLLAVIVGFMLLSIARLAVLVGRGEKPVFSAFNDIASGALNLTLVALLVVVDCLCLFSPPSTPRAVALTRWSVIVVSAGTAFTVVATGLGLAASSSVAGVVFEALGGLLDILLKLLASAALWIILRAVSSGRLPTTAPASGHELERAGAAHDAPPVWEPSQASGSVWRTAADAAAGAAPASSVDEPVARQVPAAREGAAEALGWHRVGTDTSSPAHADGDTP